MGRLFQLDGTAPSFETDLNGYMKQLQTWPSKRIAVGIGNRNFYAFDEIKGSEGDLELLAKRFSSSPFHYTIFRCLNLTGNQMKKVIHVVAAELSNIQVSSFLCFISTHGTVEDDEYQLQGVDCQPVTLTHLMQTLNTTALQDVPKVFLLQACRILASDSTGGNDFIDAGVECLVISESQSGGEAEDQNLPLQTRQSTNKVPREWLETLAPLTSCPRNFLVAYSCRLGQGVTDFVPGRSERMGFMTASIDEVLQQYDGNPIAINLLELLTEANGFCCNNYEAAGSKYTFVLEHTLTNEDGLVFS